MYEIDAINCVASSMAWINLHKSAVTFAFKGNPCNESI